MQYVFIEKMNQIISSHPEMYLILLIFHTLFLDMLMQVISKSIL